MTTNITALAQRLKVAAKNGCCHTLFPDDCLALVEALEKAQHEAIVDWEAAASLNVENQELKRRIAELEDAEQKLCAANVTLDARAELAERRLAEMESRTVTVSKSDIFNVPGGETYVGGEMISVDTLRLYLAEHGIKLEAE
ncbi:hypothetical protein [Klebsiella michiganensis]|uniref:hypothetical protein n=1 Tax=Klebsiella michiganensis TaxID=1134687 RepID=UPI0007CCC52C|nr:hypothetical protein [Klebsiella michiganensis]EKV5143712.1 hypothetical protein [Klebsiella michiganensis]MBA4429909.1 hypothetical protein [Klebsiella michiganensis]MEB6467908.1 hypothetical protein [Klebsiella michiganensis]SAP43246.1 Uncharacterised protein [Klebsiella michiganensis]HBK4624708.1 hypothetical protein [Klebsiella michiganensis]